MKRSSLYILLLVTIFVALQSALAGPIYVIKERDGSLRFTNKSPKPDETYQEFTSKRGSLSWIHGGHGYQGKLFPNKFEDLIRQVSEAHRVNPHLIRAVIHAESGFNPKALSPKGARGLMQLMPGTAQELGVTNSFDPDQNIRGGTRYLAELLQRYAGNTKKALAAYNAGPGAVDTFSGIPPYTETINYVDRVLALTRRYASKAAS